MCQSHSVVLFIDNFLSHHTIPTCVRHIPVCCLLTTFYHITLCPRVSVTFQCVVYWQLSFYHITFQCVVYWQLSITSHYTHVCLSHSSVLFIDNFLSHHTTHVCQSHSIVFIDNFLSHHTIPTCVSHIPVCWLLTTFYHITLYPHVSVTFQCVDYWQLSITSHYAHVCLSHSSVLFIDNFLSHHTTHVCQSHSSVLFIDNFLSHHTIPTCVRHIPVCCLLTTFYHITLYPHVSVTFRSVVYWQLSITSHYTHMCHSHSSVLFYCQLSITSHYTHVCQTHSSVFFIDNFLSHHTIPTCVSHIP